MRRRRPPARCSSPATAAARGCFRSRNHDAGAVARAFGPIPLAGFFAQGELGPIGQQNFIHGFTASIGLFFGEADRA